MRRSKSSWGPDGPGSGGDDQTDRQRERRASSYCWLDASAWADFFATGKASSLAVPRTLRLADSPPSPASRSKTGRAGVFKVVLEREEIRHWRERKGNDESRRDKTPYIGRVGTPGAAYLGKRYVPLTNSRKVVALKRGVCRDPRQVTSMQPSFERRPRENLKKRKYFSAEIRRSPPRPETCGSDPSRSICQSEGDSGTELQKGLSKVT